MSDWFPGTDRSYPASSDGGSMLGGNGMCLWHSTETTVRPSYANGYWPHMTLDPVSGKTWQHIPWSRAARALRNLDGGVQTNRWNVFQIEVIGTANKLPFHPVMAQVAQWLHDDHAVPLRSTVTWKAYPDSYGDSNGVRLSGAQWLDYAGHLGHQHAPENLHGDPGSPFPIGKILAPKETELSAAEIDDLKKYVDVRTDALHEDIVVVIHGKDTEPSRNSLDSLAAAVEVLQGKVDQIIAKLTPAAAP